MAAPTPQKPTVDVAKATEQINEAWDKDVMATLQTYIAIPNQSPMFDPEWETNGHMDRALDLLKSWVLAQNVPGLKLEILREQGRTPIMWIVVPGTDESSKETVLMYGHMDKQPPMTQYWDDGLGPHKPVLKENKYGRALYGRGGADDGYSVFAALGALQVLHRQNLPHARTVILIEACEESGSRDLMHYLALKKEELGAPSLIVCLDSGCGNYEQMWMTTSLRGMCMATLRVDVLTEGVHSGMASGIVPSSFRIMRCLLDRIEDSETGKLKVESAYAPIPSEDIEMAKAVAETLKEEYYKKFPFAQGTKPMSDQVAELVLGGTWMPTVSYTGQDGLASLVAAGNVLRTHTSMRLSIRTPPTVDPMALAEEIKKVVSTDVPYGAKVSFTVEKAQKGWKAPKLAPWLSSAVQTASHAFYSKAALSTGEGGSIPFMGLLGEMFPSAQFVITGVLGPQSNAHGPNEFLHVDMAKKLTGCCAQVLTDHYKAMKGSAQ